MWPSNPQIFLNMSALLMQTTTWYAPRTSDTSDTKGKKFTWKNQTKRSKLTSDAYLIERGRAKKASNRTR